MIPDFLDQAAPDAGRRWPLTDVLARRYMVIAALLLPVLRFGVVWPLSFGTLEPITGAFGFAVYDANRPFGVAMLKTECAVMALATLTVLVAAMFADQVPWGDRMLSKLTSALWWGFWLYFVGTAVGLALLAPDDPTFFSLTGGAVYMAALMVIPNLPILLLLRAARRRQRATHRSPEYR